MRVVLDIGAYDWGSLSYEFFIAFLRQASWQGFRSLEGCWQVLTWWAYEHMSTLCPQCFGLYSMIYPRAYGWSLYTIARVVLTQPSIISVALDCVTWGEILNNPYDWQLLARHEVNPTIVESHVRCWFWALSSWKFFLTKRIFHQVMSIFKVPRDPPPKLSNHEVILDDPT